MATELPDDIADLLGRKFEMWKHMYGSATAEDLRSRALKALSEAGDADPAEILAGVEPEYDFDDDPVSRWG